MLNDAEIEVLVSDIFERYGYDFSGYAPASFKRRINRLFSLDKFPSFAEFRYRIKSDPDYLSRLVEEISVNVTEMFRDPHFYKSLRNNIIPALASKPFIRIWHAGCSTGEEVYSMAILLQEANILHKSFIYATDLNTEVLEKAQKGIYPIGVMKQYSENYNLSGGQKDFSQYYIANYGFARFSMDLSEKMLFSQHNLVSDGSFNEFDLILCRNVMIYFDKALQDRVLNLFDQSLSKLGYLALGSKESLKFSNIISRYKQIDTEKIWRKIK